MGNFFAELKRRHIYRVAAAYAVVAWLLLQIVNNVAPFIRLPDWAGGFFLVLLMIGFPLALIFAWVLELKSSDAPPRTAASDWVLAAVALAVIVLVSYQQFAPSRAPVVDAAKTGLETARFVAAKAEGISIAVLPFANLSSDKEQEFFSDGMTEELTSALAKVPDLRVVGRTSAFQFKGQNEDLRDIGRKLNATHLIEGSVRKAGDQVRVTVQLIKSDDGTHVWTEDYNRRLTDIFQIQEDIARAVTASLNMSLGLKPGENLISNRRIDPDTYQQYLRAKARFRAGGINSYANATALLEQVVARDADYAPAWALLGECYLVESAFAARSDSLEEAKRNKDAFDLKAAAAVKRAIQLDPNRPEAYASQAFMEAMKGRFAAEEELLQKALALDPGNPDILDEYTFFLADVGRVKEVMPIRLQLQAVEPFVPTFNMVTAGFLWLTGQNNASIAALEAMTTLRGLRGRGLARAYATSGQFKEAADALAGIPPRVIESVEIVVEAAKILRSAPAKLTSTDALPDLRRLGWVYLYVGAPEEAIRYQERMASLNQFVSESSYEIWHADFAPLRRTERFKNFVRNSGLVDYWKARGWPEFCHPTTSDDFECK